MRDDEKRVIGLLLDVANKAFFAMDSTCDDGNGLHWDEQSFDELSAAMDKLEELPDDKPGVTMGPATKAEWALRDLLHQLHNKTDTDRIADLERQNAELVQQLAAQSEDAARLEKVIELFTDYERLMAERNDQSGMFKYAELHDYIAAMQAGKAGALKRCAANRDGECGHAQCPQLRDGEPMKSGRHCPLDYEEDEE